MGEYLNSWWRKCGIVTLIAACVFAAGWVRSQTNLDALFRLNQTNTHELSSYDGRLHWTRIWPITIPRPSRWLYRHNGQIEPTEDPWEGCEIHWKVTGLGFVLSAFSTQEAVPGLAPHTVEFESWDISYWAFVVPLTLLSGWLLLKKSSFAVGPARAEDGR